MYRYISGGSNDSSRTSPCVCKESWPRGGLSGGLGHCAGLPCGNQQLLSEAQLAATRSKAWAYSLPLEYRLAADPEKMGLGLKHIPKYPTIGLELE